MLLVKASNPSGQKKHFPILPLRLVLNHKTKRTDTPQISAVQKSNLVGCLDISDGAGVISMHGYFKLLITVQL